MRIDTDRFIVCGKCGETEHFSTVTIAQANVMAKQGGWKTKDGEPICVDCQTKRDDEETGE